ncbi:unnamed protein product [Cyprideis torosa]|uniref:Uncharacterized protein n=1 Tax=Cyprideis torosa TaxID=163714 RepID=A0A7R8ZV11_9CRUS|nr:unnamed protein product [Cyprideis torosa]CAG0901492.1 unnamed protein product [Cyprideis torosa]
MNEACLDSLSGGLRVVPSICCCPTGCDAKAQVSEGVTWCVEMRAHRWVAANPSATLPSDSIAAVSARSNGGQLLPTTNMRIINGEDARPNQFPHQVSLRVGNSHFCGGSIISSEWIVSAAHCVLIGQPFEVVAGTNSLSSGGSRHQVVEGYYDSNWDSNIIVYDYAVVRVSPPFTFSDAVQPISLGSGDPNANSRNYKKVSSLTFDSGFSVIIGLTTNSAQSMVTSISLEM